MKRPLLPIAFACWLASAFAAFAAQLPDVSFPEPWQLGFVDPASPVMERLDGLHDFLLWIITLITIFVLVLMVYIAVRFNHKANPVPSKTVHNTRLEVIWTVIPIIVLVAIAIPSLRLHYYMERPVETDMTLKVVGNQWYWHYEYPDHGGFGFDSNMKQASELKDGEHRLLAVDNHVVVPVNAKVRVLLTGSDVIHAWAVPALGVKRDAVPGRLNDTWFQATKTGRFYGQCSELCGTNHAFMPIVVDVVEKEEFDRWVAQKQKEAGIVPAAAEKVQPSAVTSTPVAAPQKIDAPMEKAKKPAKEAAKKAEPKKPASKPASKREEVEESEADASSKNNENAAPQLDAEPASSEDTGNTVE